MGGFRRGMSELHSGITGAAGAFRNFTAGIVQGMGQAFGNASIRMIREFGDAMTGTLRNAASMEQGVADIRSVMGTTAEQTQKLSDLITDLGIDPKLKVTATEASRAIETLAKNGVGLDSILGGAARSTVLLSNSTGGDFATSADVATSAMAQFKIRADAMSGAVDQIVGVTRNSKFDINDYRLAISQAGGVAASVGVSFDDFNAAIADIAPLFASGSDAGTSFKTFLQRLVPDSEPAKNMMRSLGLLTRDGTNAFFDASGQMKSMAEIAGILENATKGLSEEQKISAFSTIFGTDAMRAAFALADGGAGSIDKLKATIGKTSAEEAAAVRMDTLKGSWEIFQGILETISIQIGQKFLPNARGVVQWATDLATRNGPALVEFFGRIANLLPGLGQAALGFFDMITGPGVTKTVSLLAGALVGLGKTLGELARPFRDAFQGLFTELAAMRGVGIVDIFKVIVRRLGVALSEFGSYMRANAIPFVREQFNKFRDQLYDWIRSVNWWERTKAWAAAFWEWSVDLWTQAKPYLQDFWIALSSWVTDPAKRKQLWDGVVTGWNVFSEWAGNVWTWMKPGLADAWGELSAWVTDPEKRKQLWNNIITGWNVFVDYAGMVWAWMEPGLASAWGWLTSWVTDPAKRAQLWDSVVTGWNIWTDWSAKIKEWIEPGLVGTFDWLRSWITDPEKRKQLWDGIVSNWDVFTGFALLLVPGMGPGLALGWAFLHDWVKDPEKRKRLIEGVTDWGNSITGFAKWLWEGGGGITGLKPTLQKWWDDWNQWMKDNFPEVKKELDKITVDFGDFFKELDQVISDKSDDPKRTWSDVWKDIFGESTTQWELGLVEILKGIDELTVMMKGAAKILQGFKNNEWGPVWEGLKDIASGAWSLIKRNLDVNPFFQGIQDVFTKYGGLFKNFFNGLNQDLTSAADKGDIYWKKIKEGISWAMSGIGDAIKNANVGASFTTIVDTFNSVMDGFKTHVLSVMRDVGRRIIDGIVEGIKNGQQILNDALNWVTSAMPDWVKNALGIRSPSKVFAEIGKNISMGLAEGIEDNIKLPELSVKRLVKTTVDAPKMALSQTVSAESAGARNRLDVYLHAETQLPTNRQALREIVIGLQRELQLTGARVAY